MNYEAHSKIPLFLIVFVYVLSVILTVIFKHNFIFETNSFLYISIIFFIGANSPDIDTHSKPSRVIAIILLCYNVFCFYAQNYKSGLILSTVFIAAKTLRHRGLTHSYLMPTLIVAYFYFFAYHSIIEASFFALGLCLHYLLDSLNPFKLKNWIVKW
jgi:membrane-bound metal-dependent hydrolase YbcI (DUF457 family)